ncbi:MULTISPECIES: excinuclease ABC subunit UvrA [unclassified Isoptericola]|uniref:excinuclease ABC subunit UvrA n=1 Tax=unclassified Isoptericola TaxID=2623355 RepID=UPI0027124F6B|nr:MULTISPECIES: excinuclease ABC subunit UvrA [unclassified Isoptericola]MDO8144810.1 excinuclease ABC subunit UvrA [Isoptericola sp. 178]MDO8149590.1 excinuclease ABC subunit UvrA [Isoptericola sp. b515]
MTTTTPRPAPGAAVHPADRHDRIRVVGARENNLREVSVELPKRRLTVFTGVSGSGKSSLVFATIAAESRRLIDETYPTFLQGFMASLPRPDVDELEGVTTAIVVDQERLGANARSTVGTVTDAHAMLRHLFSRAGDPYVGPPAAFSFNVPTSRASGVMRTEAAGGGTTTKIVREAVYLGGMCPECEGRGTVSDLDLSVIVDESRSLNDGAILVPGYKADGWMVRGFSESGFLDGDKPIKDYTATERHDFLYRDKGKIKALGMNMTYQGLIPKLRESIFSKDPDALQPHVRRFVERAAVFAPCPACEGSRLNDAARSATVHGRNIAEVARMQITDAADWVREVDDPGVAPLVANLARLFDAFVAIGLGYLSLDRPAGTLSGGEAQRVKMIRHLGSALTDVTYVFDEPTSGLHPHDIARMNTLLEDLRDKGNTVLVVEHKPETIAIADHVVDLGPGAGSDGGTITYEGDVAGLRAADTLTGRHLDDRARLKDTVREPTGALEIRGARQNNLRAVDVDVPTGVLTVVTGVAGSGKSSLIHGNLAGREGVVVVDQGAIKGSRRSNPATYTGLLDPVRKAFAKANGVKPALFSANSEGACPTCQGNGRIYTELGFMETVETVCEECGGRRFQAAVLEYTLGGKNIADVLDLSVAQAHDFFGTTDAEVPAARTILGHLHDVGLGYLRLGQPLNTLSGGERQRLRLAMRMGDDGGVLVLDEPTTGLHLADVAHLLALLDRLVDAGRTVVVIEHHQAVMAHADRIIDLGPGAGHDGGTVVFEGTPADLVAARATLTGKHLADYVGA